MDENNFYTELYNTLDDNGIAYSDERSNRDNAIKIIIELKRRKAKKIKKVVVNEEDIISNYIQHGIESIKKMFNRNDCYLYESDFVFSVLFFHYKANWNELEKLINWKIVNDYE
tara:strand:+ start:1065 stop:1406 length:342 start_codon:yes stop_codon:yes gene_type:complete